jgi:hypothetical protein
MQHLDSLHEPRFPPAHGELKNSQVAEKHEAGEAKASPFI